MTMKQFFIIIYVIAGLQGVPIMTSLRYTKATNKYAWIDTSLTLSYSFVGWSGAPNPPSDSCFWYLNGKLVPTACEHPEGFHFICES